MTTRRRSSSAGVMSPGRLGSTSSAIKTESRSTSWLNDFTVESTIGRGKFAVVKKCVEKSTGRYFAAKCIRRRRHNRDCTPDILHEIAVLELSANHPYLIDLYRVYETSSEVVLILEYAAGGEIFDHCVGVKDTFSESMSRRLMLQILEGVVFLHERDIVHLDLKPQNILLTKDGTESDANIKLVDFGLSKYITNGLEIREILGTPDYVAPEVLNYEPISTATDIWSLGVVNYVMLTGVSPFLGDSKQETLMNVTTATLEFPPDLFEHLSPACQDLIHRMLKRDPCDRLTAKDSLSHPWVSGIVSPSIPIPVINEDKETSSSDEDVFSSNNRKLTNGHSFCECAEKDDQSSVPCSSESKTSLVLPEIIITECKESQLDLNGNTCPPENGKKENEKASSDKTVASPQSQTQSLESSSSSKETVKDNKPSNSETDFNGNIINASSVQDVLMPKEILTESKTNSTENHDFLGQVKRRLSSEGERMETPGTCITGTNFADVMHQDPIMVPVGTSFHSSHSETFDFHVQPTSTIDDKDCCHRSCCSILPVPHSQVHCISVSPSDLDRPKPETMSRRESDKENYDFSSCEKLTRLSQSKTLSENSQKDEMPVCSPRLNCLSLSSCTNSPNTSNDETVYPTSAPDILSNDVDNPVLDSTPSSLAHKHCKLTMRVPRSCLVPVGSSSLSNTQHADDLQPSESVFISTSSLPTLQHIDPVSSIAVPDPSLKRRKFDFCSPKEQNSTEISVVD